MKGYILSVAGAVLLAAAVAVICPSGKMGKFVRGMAKLAVFAVMLSPLLSLAGKGELFRPFSANIGSDEGYYRSCADLLEKADGEAVAAYLEEEFGVKAEVCTERAAREGFPLLKISVKITDGGIIGQDGHINRMTRIKEALEEKYACPAEVTWIGNG